MYLEIESVEVPFLIADFHITRDKNISAGLLFWIMTPEGNQFGTAFHWILYLYSC